MDNWNKPEILQAAKQIAKAKTLDEAIDSCDGLYTASLDDNEKALAYYLANALIRISDLVADEIALTKILNEGN